MGVPGIEIEQKVSEFGDGPVRQRTHAVWRDALLMAACGFLGAIPFTGGAGRAAWFMLAPVCYVLAETRSFRRAFCLATLFSLSWLFPILWFTHPHTKIGMGVLVLYTAMYYIAALLVLRALARRGIVAAIFGGSAVWVLVELIRSRVPIFGFPWNLLGHACWQDPILLQAADLLGVYGLSFLMVAINTTLAYVLPPFLSDTAQVPRGSGRLRHLCGAVVMFLLLGALAYGHVRRATLEPQIVKGPVFALLQGCTYQKVNQTSEQREEQLEVHLALHRQAIEEAPENERPQLICWAETMVPGVFNRDHYAQRFRAEIKVHGVPTLCGADWVHEEDKEVPDIKDQRWYNSALILDGAGEILTRYAKRRLVPFGEYIPGRRTFPILGLLESVTGDTYEQGMKPAQVTEVAGLRLGMNICVEDIFPEIAREATLQDAEVLMNISNDAWFVGTSGGVGHLQAAFFRAIETRRPLVRVTNSGITVQVTPLGDLEQPLKPDVIGIARVQIKTLNGSKLRSLYTRMGDLAVAGIMLLILLTAWFSKFNPEV